MTSSASIEVVAAGGEATPRGKALGALPAPVLIFGTHPDLRGRDDADNAAVGQRDDLLQAVTL
jgi:hypothetical protein